MRDFAGLERHLDAGAADFVDGTVFSPDRKFITLGTFTDRAPYTSDYTYERIYYRSIAERSEDYLSVSDYLCCEWSLPIRSANSGIACEG